MSLIVLNWNGRRFIDPFFESLEKVVVPRGYELEKIFVDNNSSDDSVSYVKSKYKDVKIVCNDKNYGYAEGNNRGIKAAKGEFILVTNNDVHFDKNWLSELVKAAEDNPDKDLFVPKLVFANKNLINNAGSMLVESSDWPIVEIGVDEKITSEKVNRDYEITAFCGANVLFRRSFLEEVGLFDKYFFMYFEDGDLSWRGQKMGKKFMYVHKSVVFHEHTGTSKEGSPLFNHCVSRNRILILAKNAPLKVFIKGYLKVFRDHVVLKSKQLIGALVRGSNRKLAALELVRGIMIMFDASLRVPIMFMKRTEILKEQKL